MKFCNQCNKEYPDEVAFCPFHGIKLTERAAKQGNVCKNGHANPPDAKFCFECGVPLNTEPPKKKQTPKKAVEFEIVKGVDVSLLDLNNSRQINISKEGRASLAYGKYRALFSNNYGERATVDFDVNAKEPNQKIMPPGSVRLHNIRIYTEERLDNLLVTGRGVREEAQNVSSKSDFEYRLPQGRYMLKYKRDNQEWKQSFIVPQTEFIRLNWGRVFVKASVMCDFKLYTCDGDNEVNTTLSAPLDKQARFLVPYGKYRLICKYKGKEEKHDFEVKSQRITINCNFVAEYNLSIKADRMCSQMRILGDGLKQPIEVKNVKEYSVALRAREYHVECWPPEKGVIYMHEFVLVSDTILRPQWCKVSFDTNRVDRVVITGNNFTSKTENKQKELGLFSTLLPSPGDYKVEYYRGNTQLCSYSSKLSVSGSKTVNINKRWGDLQVDFTDGSCRCSLDGLFYHNVLTGRNVCFKNVPAGEYEVSYRLDDDHVSLKERITVGSDCKSLRLTPSYSKTKKAKTEWIRNTLAYGGFYIAFVLILLSLFCIFNNPFNMICFGPEYIAMLNGDNIDYLPLNLMFVLPEIVATVLFYRGFKKHKEKLFNWAVAISSFMLIFGIFGMISAVIQMGGFVPFGFLIDILVPDYYLDDYPMRIPYTFKIGMYISAIFVFMFGLDKILKAKISGYKVWHFE